MKNAKKIIATLLAVITLFSVMTLVAAAADADPGVTVNLNEAAAGISDKITEHIINFGQWCAGLGAFLGSIVVMPILWVVSQFVNIDIG